MMNSTQIQVDIPDELGITLQLKGDALANEMIRLAIIKLYELGKFSSGKAAQMLGISRVAFLELCGAYEVSVIGNMTVEELKSDIYNAGQKKSPSSESEK